MRSNLILQHIVINKLGYGGIGIARSHDGKKILVSGGVLPGAEVDILVTKKKKDFFEGKVFFVHKHAADYEEINPPCKHYFGGAGSFFERENSSSGEGQCPHDKQESGQSEVSPQPNNIAKEHSPQRGCGGCKRQQVRYEKQLQLKTDIFLDSFRSVKKHLERAEILDIIPSPLQRGYRNKIEYSFGDFKMGESFNKRALGFHKQGHFSQIIDIDQCLLVTPLARSIFQRIKHICYESGLPVYNLVQHHGFFRHLVVREGVHTGQFLVNLSVADECFCENETLPPNTVTTLGKESKPTKSDDSLLQYATPQNPPATESDAKSRNIDMLQESYLVEHGVNSSLSQSNTQAGLLHQLRASLQGDEFLKKHITSFVISSNNGLGDSVLNKDTRQRILRGDGYIFETLSFQATAEERTSLPDNVTASFANDSSKETTYRISANSFFQTNTKGAEILFQTALRHLGDVRGPLIDLYCGTGTIGIAFHKMGIGDSLYGIEIVPEAIIDAHHNAAINGLTDTYFIAGKVEDIMNKDEKILAALQQTQCIIVDPPRDGLHKNALSFLKKIKQDHPFKLLYISCNPTTLARDIDMLADFFTVKILQPVDMFPNTHHIETICLLS